MTYNKTTELTIMVPNPKLPKHLCTNISPIPTNPDVPTPPLLKTVVINAKKKISKKKSQADNVDELAKRRDDLLDSIENEIKPFIIEQSSCFAETIETVFPYMEKQQKQNLGLEEELAKAQTTSSEQSILLGKKDLAKQNPRVKCQGLVNNKKARDKTIKTLKA